MDVYFRWSYLASKLPGLQGTGMSKIGTNIRVGVQNRSWTRSLFQIFASPPSSSSSQLHHAPVQDLCAAIRVNGVDLPHLRPEYDEGQNTATCWIPSEAGQEYASFVKLDGPQLYGLSCSIYLDGNSGAGMAIDAFQSQGQCDGVYSAGDIIQPFVFANLRTTGLAVEPSTHTPYVLVHLSQMMTHSCQAKPRSI